MRGEPRPGRHEGELLYDFAVTQAQVGTFVDQVIGRCYATEASQYVEVYDAVEPFRHEGIMDISLYCECQPDFRFIIAFTQEFGVSDASIIKRDDRKFLVFHEPARGIAELLYRMLRTYVDEGALFGATSQDDREGAAWVAEVLLPRR
jgi:hypothetical protein